MASQAPQLPIMYQQVQPLSTQAHANYKTRGTTEAPFLARMHAVPLVVDEFVSAQRFYPIVFSVGENPTPLGLMGLNEGVNTFVDDKGALLGPTYVPAYLRRYPFLLARLREGDDNLSLCFDPTSGLVGEFEEGTPLFENGQPSQATNDIMKFCEEFEIAAQRTNAFVEELKKSDLLIDGELKIEVADQQQPFIYRGFKMVDEAKLRDMRGDELRKLSQNGILPLLYAHLFSLPLARDIFSRQVAQGKGPQVARPQAEPAQA